MTEQIAIVDVDLADGTGGDLRRCDVLVDGERIARVCGAGDLPTAGAQVVRGTGLVLAPGFIDVHSHADNAALLDEPDLSKILQGVTTEVVGNCGFTLAPRGETAPALDALLQRIFPEMAADWGTFAELYRTLDARGYVTNMAPLAGHHALRIQAMGMSDAAPDPAQQSRMAAGLAEAMEAGAFGLSTGLIYPPGLFSDTDELVQLAGTLPPHGIYATHMRGEGRNLADSVREAVRIGRESGRRVQVSHLKAAGRPYWGGVAAALELLDRARADGVDIRHDVYPYTASSTMLTALLPPWFQEGGNEAVLARLADPAARDRVRAEIEAGPAGGWENMAWAAGWPNIVIASTGSGDGEGLSVAELAGQWGCAPFDAVVRLLTAERLRASMTVHQMSEDDLTTALAHPLTMIGSDGLPPGTGGRPHPRTWGTFPRVLGRYSREQGLLTLPEAIRRMTSLPAQTFRIPDRGIVTEGAIADLVAFDPATVADRASYQQPTTPPAGIAFVMQAGAIVVRDGEFGGRRGGRRLRPATGSDD
jgi:N-acyl-D-aspartate/D-glutamate deacylase